MPKIIERRPVHSPVRCGWSAVQQCVEELSSDLVQADTPDSTTEYKTLGDVACLAIHNPSGAPWVYFRAGLDFSETTTLIQIRFRAFCETRQKIWIEYDSSDPSVLVVADKPGAFKCSDVVEIQAGAWQEFSFLFSDIKFTKRINGSSFRIVCTEQPNHCFYLQSVSVSQVPDKTAADNERDWLGRNGDALQNLEFGYSKYPSASIIIPFYNCLEFTLQCLIYLRENTSEAIELILVDDGSDLCATDILESIPGITLLSNRENLGYTKSCNIGAQEARGTNLVFLNNDTIPMRGWLSELLNCLSRFSDAGVIGSKLIYPNSDDVQHAGVLFDPFGVPFHVNRYQLKDSKIVNVEGPIPSVTGACLATPRNVFEQLGGFDESFQNGFEDTDYCLRIQQSGKSVIYCPTSELMHYESVTEGRVDVGQEAQNLSTFKNRWLGKLSIYSNKQDREKKLSRVASSVTGGRYLAALRYIAKLFKAIENDLIIGCLNDSDKSMWRLIQAFCFFHTGQGSKALASLSDITVGLLHEEKALFRKYFLPIQGDKNTQYFDTAPVVSRNDSVKPRVVIYTSLFGNYDNLPPLLATCSWIDFVCFTDQPLTDTEWAVRQSPRTTDNDNLEAKRYKVLPWEYLDGYDYSLYVDANTLFYGNLDVLVQNYLLGNDFVGWAHPERHDLVAESFAIYLSSKFDKERTFHQLQTYIDNGVSTDIGLMEASFLWRRHNSSAVKNLMRVWWDHIVTHSQRDQVSLSYLMKSENFSANVLSESFGTVRDNCWFRKNPHRHEIDHSENIVPNRSKRKKCVFIYDESFRKSGSALMRCFQAIEILSELKPELNTIATASTDVKDSIVILAKSKLKRIKTTDIERIKANNNIILADFVDDPIRLELVPFLDGVIAASISGYLYLTNTLAQTQVFHLTHAVDVRLPNPKNLESLKMGYFGELVNTVTDKGISKWVDFHLVNTKKTDVTWAQDICNYNCHYIVRKKREIDGFKPFLKGFTAAHMNAPVIVEGDNPEADYYLGPDYPFKVDANDMNSITACLDRVLGCYGDELWVEAVQRMANVKERSTRQLFANEFERMIQSL